MLIEIFLLLAFGIACAFFDFRYRKIPNYLSYSFLLLGLVFGVRDFAGLLSVVASLAFGYVIWKQGAWGAADARLLCAFQCFSLVFIQVKWFFLVNFLSSVLLFFVWIVLSRQSLSIGNIFSKEKRHSFALFLFLGFLAGVFGFSLLLHPG